MKQRGCPAFGRQPFCVESPGVDIGFCLAYNHAVPQRCFFNGGRKNFMAKKLKKGKKIAAKKSLIMIKN